MLVLRCTARLLPDMRQHVPEAAPGDVSTTRLGDWFANRINIAQRRYIIAVSATTLLPVIVHARDPARLAARLTDALATLLPLIDVDERAVSEELAEMRTVRVASTNNRSIVASMNDAAQRGYQELYDLPHRPGRTLGHINLLLAAVSLATLDHRSPADVARASLS